MFKDEDKNTYYHKLFFEHFANTLRKGSTKTGGISVTFEEVPGVVQGAKFTLRTVGSEECPAIEQTLWVGLNERKLYLAVAFSGLPKSLGESLKSTTLELMELGCDFRYEQMPGESLLTVLSGQAMAESYFFENQKNVLNFELTRIGRFWSVELARFTEKLLRNMELYKLEPAFLPPQ